MEEEGASRAAIHALSSAALSTMIEHSIDCVKLIGLDGKLLYVNASGLRMMGIPSLGDVLGDRWADLYPPGIAASALEAYRAAAAKGGGHFRTYFPTPHGLPRWWDTTVSPAYDAAGTPIGYLCVSRDVTESQATREALEIGSAEVKHRLKNAYTMVAGLLTAFARGNAEHEAFATRMTERLSSLSTAQTMFLSNEAHCELARLIPVLLAPFDNPGCPIVVDAQATVIVDQGIADAIALVLGELSVNSAKHGALNHGGEIHLASHAQDGILSIRWAERARRPVRARDRDGGQGLRLIERIVRTRGGTYALEWHEDGLTVTLAFPHAATIAETAAA